MDLLCHSKKSTRFTTNLPKHIKLLYILGFPSSSAPPTSQNQIPFGISSPTGLLCRSISWKRSNSDRTRLFLTFSVINVIYVWFSGCYWSAEILAKNTLAERSYVPQRAWRDFRCYWTFRIFKNYDALIQSTCQMRFFATLSGWYSKSLLSSNCTQI